MTVNLIVTVGVAEEHWEDFLNAMRIDCHGSRKEKGCLAFDVIQDEKSKETFYFYETYVDEAALEQHKKEEHFKPWVAFKESGRVRKLEVIRGNGLF